MTDSTAPTQSDPNAVVFDEVPVQETPKEQAIPPVFASWAPYEEGTVIRTLVLALRTAGFALGCVSLAAAVSFTNQKLGAFWMAVNLSIMVWFTIAISMVVNLFEIVTYLLVIVARVRPMGKWGREKGLPMRIPPTFVWDALMIILTFVVMHLQWNDLKDLRGFHDEVRKYGDRVFVGLFGLAICHSVMFLGDVIGCGVYCNRQRSSKAAKRRGEPEAVEMEPVRGPVQYV